MSLLKGLEGLSARMEDEQETVVEETTVDVEVRVAEEVEAETAISEEATAIVEDAAASDDAAEEIEALESFVASIEKYGLTQQGLELMNHKGALAAFSGRALPAVESLDAAGRNHEAAQETLAALEGAISRGWEAVKKFFKSIWDRIKGWVSALVNKVASMEGAIKRSMESVKGVEFDSAKAAEKTVKFYPVATFKTMSSATLNAGTTLVKLNAANAANADYVKKEFGPKAKDLSDIGITIGDKKVEVDAKSVAPAPIKLSESKWTPSNCEDAFTNARLCASNLRELPKFAAAFGKMCEAGIAAVTSMSASSTEKVDPKEKVEIIRANVSMVSNISTAVVARTLSISRMYIGICAAVKSCSKAAAKAEDKK